MDKYTWVDIGSSFLPGELVAAYLYGQLEQIASIQEDRRRSWLAYDNALAPFRARGVAMPVIPNACEHNAHLYYLILPTLELRSELIARMKADAIVAPFHYVPLHSAPAGRRYGRTAGAMTHTDDLSARLLRLPLYPGMGSDLDRVIERVSFHLEALV